MQEEAADEAINIALEFGQRKVSLSEMILDEMDDYQTILGGQRARLIGDAMTEPMSSQVDRLVVKDAKRKFLEQCLYEPRKVAELLRRRADAKA